jgi:hypothetical protein
MDIASQDCRIVDTAEEIAHWAHAAQRRHRSIAGTQLRQSRRNAAWALAVSGADRLGQRTADSMVAAGYRSTVSFCVMRTPAAFVRQR